MIKYHVAFNIMKSTDYLTTEEYRELPILELSEVAFQTPEEARDWFEKYEDTLDPNDNYNNPVIVSVMETSTKNTTERYASYSKYVRSISAIGGTVLFVLTVIGMFMLANYVNAWEQAHNYPYGKLCELYNNCSK